ncbi:hypothetical protein [Sphingomonas sp. VL_57B]|jgi:hypothetical protein|uniref:phage tail fiber protein n=1 Tax=Sphingomonas sp. VL_57B TaxID=3144220 RepID=UPI0031F4F79F
MNNRTLTSANAILLLSVNGLFDTARRIEGFSSDDITDADAIETVETSMGVDGRLSGGYVPVATRQNIVLQADSLSIDFFETWDSAEQAVKEKYVAQGTLLIPATQRKYTLTRGFLRGISRIPGLKKTIQPRRLTIEWERITPAPY